MLEEDERLRGLYLMLDRVDVHCVWVSQAVLNLLPEDIPDVPGGEIIRKPGMGVFCDNAIDLVTALWPRPGREKKREFVKDAMRKLHEVGLVGMHDAGTVPNDLALFRDMSLTEDWTLRVYAMLECQERNTFCPADAGALRQENGLLTIKSVKLFAGRPPFLRFCNIQSHTLQTAPLAPGVVPCSLPTRTALTLLAPSSSTRRPSWP